MSALKTIIDPKSNSFAANREAMMALVEDLRAQLAKVRTNAEFLMTMNLA